jgi:hypothetical protein
VILGNRGQSISQRSRAAHNRTRGSRVGRLSPLSLSSGRLLARAQQPAHRQLVDLERLEAPSDCYAPTASRLIASAPTAMVLKATPIASAIKLAAGTAWGRRMIHGT